MKALPKFILLLAVLSILFYWKIFLHPTNFVAGGDNIEYEVMFHQFINSALNQYKEMPLWNPYVFAGSPFSSDIIGGRYFPTHIFFWFYYKDFFLKFQYPLYIFLAGLFTFLFMRKIKQTNFPALTAAIIFMFSGNLIQRSLGGDASHFLGISLIPLIYLSTEYLLQQPNIRNLVFLSITVALQFFSGHIQYLFFTIVSIIFYFLYRVFQSKENLKSTYLKKIIFTTFLSIFFFIGLISIQLLPTLEFANFAFLRGENANLQTASKGSLPPQHLINLFIPYFFGNRLQGTYWGAPHAEYYLYLGILPIILAIIGIFGKKSKYKHFFIGLLFFSLLFALGKYTPFFKLLYNYFPGFNYFSVPSRMLSLFSFSISVLAGLGVSILADKDNKKPLNRTITISKLVLICSSILLIFILIFKSKIISFGTKLLNTYYYEKYSNTFLVKKFSIEELLPKVSTAYNNILLSIFLFSLLLFIILLLFYFLKKDSLNQNKFRLLIIIIIVTDIWFFGYGVMDLDLIENNFYPNKDIRLKLLDKTPVIEFLQNDNSIFRIDDLGEKIIPQQLAVRYHIFSIRGFNSLVHRDYMSFIKNFINYSDTNVSEYLGIMNVKYIITKKNLSINDLKLLQNLDGVNIYENLNYLPRAFITNNYSVLDNQSKVTDFFGEKKLISKNEIILETDPTIQKGNFFQEVNISNYSPNVIKLNFNAPQETILYFSELYYPGWKIYDNGNHSYIYRANFIFKAIKVDEGNHEIELRYNPTYYKIGLIISIITIIAIIILLILINLHLVI